MDLDRISDLPTEIVDNLLMFLPLKDATRTCLLSKKWRFKALHTPQLVFNHDHQHEYNKGPEQFLFHIYQLMLLHRGPLHTFVLSLPYLVKTESYILFFDAMIPLLSGKCVQQLTLCPPRNNHYILPSNLFHCIHVRHLNLACCEIRLPPEFTRFNHLISIQLLNVCISANDFNTLISKSPLLQQLKLATQGEGNPFEIDAPNLESLYFDCPLRSIILNNVPLLSRVVIKGYDKQAWHSSSNINIDKMFASLSSIKYLCASHSFLRFLSADFSAKRLPSMLNHLESVELSELRLYSLKEVQFVLLLIKCSPNLQKLMIKLYPNNNGDNVKPTIEVFKTLRLAKEDYFQQLEQVTLKDIDGTMYELEFIHLLLAKSLALKKIIVRQNPSGRHLVDNKVIESFKRQKDSPKVKIIYFLWYEDLPTPFEHDLPTPFDKHLLSD